MKNLIDFIKQSIFKKEKMFIVLFFLLLYLFGLSFVGDVGYTNDEYMEQKIVKMNIHEYARQFSEDNDLVKYFINNDIDPISENIERDHGVAPYYLFSPFLSLDNVSSNLLSTSWHLFTYSLFFLGVICLYLLCKTLFKSKPIALITTLIFFFTPRMLIDGMFNNKDSILLSFTIMSLYFGVCFIKKKSYKSAILFGLVSAVACNLKISGMFVFGMIGLCYLINLIIYKKWTKKAVIAGFLAIFSCLSFYILITPAIWGSGFDLIGFIQYSLENSTKFSRWNGDVLFEGVLYNNATNPLPWYYLPKMIIITIPVFIIVLVIYSIIVFGYKIIKEKAIKKIDTIYIMLFSILIIPLVAAMLSEPNIYNGWRHFYFLFAPIVLMAGFGIYYSAKFKWSNILKIIVVILVAINCIIVCIYGVFCTCYYNVLATGNVTEKYELNYYSAATRVILRDIVDNGRGRDDDGKFYISAQNYAADELSFNHSSLPKRYRDQIVIVNDSNRKEIKNKHKQIIYYVNPTYDFDSYDDYKKIYEKKMLGYTIYYLYQK